ncbi:amidoligase family protein, partial [Cellulomonas wangsupingiae]|uniref:amidoligase family protein n=1 Tax=Cellulomonas wangsupingiae TaxID=2968085 RepID=UPI001D0E8922
TVPAAPAGRGAGRAAGAPPRGWYRLLSDDARLLRLVERLVDATAPLPTVLDPVADLFGVRADVFPAAARVNDPTGATIAVALPLPPGRERPCEVVTPPLTQDHARVLERLLAPARELGFTVPQEAAVHLHVDAAPYRRPTAFANLVRLFTHWREPLWAALGTNPACRRLAPLPDALVALVAEPWPQGDDAWSGLAEAARATGLTKYADVNLVQLVATRPVRDTVEVRILPGEIDGRSIVRRAALVERLLLRCLDPAPLPRPGSDAARDPRAALEDLAAVAVR